MKPTERVFFLGVTALADGGLLLTGPVRPVQAIENEECLECQGEDDPMVVGALFSQTVHGDMSCTRKTLGASKRNLIHQFWTESVWTALISIVFGLLIAVLMLPVSILFPSRL